MPTMRYDSWTTKSSDGRTVEFAYKELSDGVAGISAKTDLISVMVIQRSIRAPLTRKQVERIFEQTVALPGQSRSISMPSGLRSA